MWAATRTPKKHKQHTDAYINLSTADHLLYKCSMFCVSLVHPNDIVKTPESEQESDNNNKNRRNKYVDVRYTGQLRHEHRAYTHHCYELYGFWSNRVKCEYKEEEEEVVVALAAVGWRAAHCTHSVHMIQVFAYTAASLAEKIVACAHTQTRQRSTTTDGRCGYGKNAAGWLAAAATTIWIGTIFR